MEFWKTSNFLSQFRCKFERESGFRNFTTLFFILVVFVVVLFPKATKKKRSQVLKKRNQKGNQNFQDQIYKHCSGKKIIKEIVETWICRENFGEKWSMKSKNWSFFPLQRIRRKNVFLISNTSLMHRIAMISIDQKQFGRLKNPSFGSNQLEAIRLRVSLFLCFFFSLSNQNFFYLFINSNKNLICDLLIFSFCNKAELEMWYKWEWRIWECFNRLWWIW